jgi:Domain of Unknown Function (DUF1206)
MNSTSARRAAAHGEREAERAAENPAVDRLGRLGILARAVMVFAVAAIAVQIVRGGGGRAADSHGALQALAGSTGGLILLCLLAVGFAGHAVWRFIEAAAGLHQDSGTTRTLKRIGFAALGVVYAVLCVTTVRVILGRNVESENQESRSATASLLSVPGGRAVTALIGVALVGAAVGVAVWALRSGFLRTLHTEHLTRRMRDAVCGLGVAGQSARAVIIAVAGWLFLDAAFENNSNKAQGIDGTLRTIADRPYGSALLLMVCAGLVIFGVFSVIQALLLRTSGDDAHGRQSKGA